MYKYVTTEEIQKEWRTKDQVQKGEGTLHVIMSKERSVVKNNFWTKFTYSLEKACRVASRLKMIVVNRYGHPGKCPKNSQKRIFFIDF